MVDNNVKQNQYPACLLMPTAAKFNNGMCPIFPNNISVGIVCVAACPETAVSRMSIKPQGGDVT